MLHVFSHKNDNNFESKTNNTMLLITLSMTKLDYWQSILTTFALFDINLSWIESRPLKTQLGMYRFFVQADTGLSDNLNKVISILETLDFSVKLLALFIVNKIEWTIFVLKLSSHSENLTASY